MGMPISQKPPGGVTPPKPSDVAGATDKPPTDHHKDCDHKVGGSKVGGVTGSDATKGAEQIGHADLKQVLAALTQIVHALAALVSSLSGSHGGPVDQTPSLPTPAQNLFVAKPATSPTSAVQAAGGGATVASTASVSAASVASAAPAVTTNAAGQTLGKDINGKSYVVDPMLAGYMNGGNTFQVLPNTVADPGLQSYMA